MKELLKKSGLKGIFNLSQLSLAGWLLLNASILFFLQKNLSYHYSLKEQAIERVYQAQSISLYTGKETTSLSTKQLEQINSLQRDLKTYAEGGILSDRDFVVSNLPENLKLRSVSLAEAVKQFREKPEAGQAAVVVEESKQLLAGFSTLAQQAENRFFTGLIGLALANLLLLFLGSRFANTRFLQKVFRLKQEVSSAEVGEPVLGEKADELDEIAENLQLVKKEVSLAASLVKLSGEGKFADNKQETSHPITSPLFSALQGMQSQMKQIAEADKQRNWTSQGLAQFVDILRSKDDDLEALAHTILSELVKYMDANQGALYLVTKNEKDETILRQEACFAFNRRKWMENEFYPGDGLVGQAYLEKETIYLTEIPQSYINITSGLGDAPPSNVLIVPLTINEEVMGVLELASFKHIPQHKIQFTEKLGENIAATLANVRNSLETRKLLEESQLMSENLRAQEEEMRQNMEELTSTQEELNRKMQEGERVQFELNARMQALNETALLSESDLYGTITYVNGKFCEVTKYSAEEAIGKPHSILRHPDNPKELFKEMWTNLKAGRIFQGQYPNVAKDGSTYWVDATIVPVLGEDGKPVKYIGVRFDITEQRRKEEEIQNLLASSEQQMAQMKAQEEVMREAFEEKAKKEEQLQQNMEEMLAQEEELRQNMEEMQAIQEEMLRKEVELNGHMNAINNTMAMIEFKLDGTVISANENFSQATGYPLDEIMGKHHRMFCDSEYTQSPAYADFWTALNSGKAQQGEFLRFNKAGDSLWLRASYTPVLNKEGQPIKVIKIAFDISEEKAKELVMQEAFMEKAKQEEELQQNMEEMRAQEEELRQNMEEMQAIQEELHSKMMENDKLKKELDARVAALDEAAILTESDLYGNIIYANRKFCEVAKYTADEVVNKPHNIIRHPDVSKDVFKQLWATIKAGKVFKGRYPNLAKDGSTYWVDATIVPVMNEEGRPEKYIGIRFLIEKEEEQIIQIHQAEAVN